MHKENMFFSLHQAINYIKFQEEDKIATDRDSESMKSLIGKHVDKVRKAGKCQQKLQNTRRIQLLSQKEKSPDLCAWPITMRAQVWLLGSKKTRGSMLNRSPKIYLWLQVARTNKNWKRYLQ